MIAQEINALINLFHHHGEWLAVAVWVFSVLVQAIPTPTPASGPMHLFFFNIGHLLAGNVGILGKRREIP